MRSYQINSATPQDMTGIKALLHACELPSHDIKDRHLEHFFVLKDDGEIIGTVGLEVCGVFGLLRSLGLRESFRGRGLGTQLVQQIERYAQSQQVGSLYLLTTTADHFFADAGYQIIPRQGVPLPIQETAEFQSICPDSAICMCKVL